MVAIAKKAGRKRNKTARQRLTLNPNLIPALPFLRRTSLKDKINPHPTASTNRLLLNNLVVFGLKPIQKIKSIVLFG